VKETVGLRQVTLTGVTGKGLGECVIKLTTETLHGKKSISGKGNGKCKDPGA
jgi:hypothetical protein